jgi:DNA-binding XRE family transcriptional regulator
MMKMENNEPHIGIRLKEFRERSGMKMPAISAIVGVAKGTMYKWEKGTKPSDLNEYFRLKTFLDKMENKQEEEIWKFENKKPAILRLPLNSSAVAVPQTNGNGIPGTIVFNNNEPELIVYRIIAPFMKPAEGVIEIKGKSMEPKFKDGCRIAITRLKDCRLLDWGHYYFIISKNWQGIIRRVYQNDIPNTIRLVSDSSNQEKYPPIERSWDQIEAILNIVAIIDEL